MEQELVLKLTQEELNVLYRALTYYDYDEDEEEVHFDLTMKLEELEALCCKQKNVNAVNKI